MIALCLNASFDLGELALVSESSEWYALPLRRTVDTDYRNLFDSVCSEAGIQRQDISAVVVGAGPGGFTALRATFAFAKGVACGLRIPLVSVSSHLAAVESLRNSSEQTISNGQSILCLSKAGRSELFASRIHVNEPHIEVVTTELLSIEALPEEHDEQLVFIGEDQQLLTAIQTQMGGHEVYSMADIRCARGLFGCYRQSKDRITTYDCYDISELSPQYGRKVSALTIAQRSGL